MAFQIRKQLGKEIMNNRAKKTRERLWGMT